jgi:hypothetical protein
MAKGLPSINLKLSKAQSCLAILRTLVAEALHENDRKQIEEMIRQADDALDGAGAIAANLRSRIDDVADQL